MYPGIADRMQKEITSLAPNYNEDQNHRSSREEVLCLDRRIHLGLPIHLPANVDLKAGVRRVRSFNCAQKMLLNCFFYFLYCILTLSPNAFLYRFRSLYLILVIVQLELK